MPGTRVLVAETVMACSQTMWMKMNDGCVKFKDLSHHPILELQGSGEVYGSHVAPDQTSIEQDLADDGYVQH